MENGFEMNKNISYSTISFDNICQSNPAKCQVQ